eukprot:1504972-Prymnesium_polylepis.1
MAECRSCSNSCTCGTQAQRDATHQRGGLQGRGVANKPKGRAARRERRAQEAARGAEGWGGALRRPWVGARPARRHGGP